MSSPRALRAARRRHFVNDNETPSQDTVSTLTTGDTVRTALHDDEDVDFAGGGAGGFDEDIGVEGNVAEEVEEAAVVAASEEEMVGQ